MAFVAIAALAMLVWLSWQIQIVRERRAMREWVLEQRGVMIEGTRADISIVRGFLADVPLRAVAVTATDEQHRRLAEVFPEAEINPRLPAIAR